MWLSCAKRGSVVLCSHTHTYTHTHTPTHTHSYTHTHIYTHLHTHSHTYTHIHTHTYIYACVCVWGCVCMCESVWMCVILCVIFPHPTYILVIQCYITITSLINDSPIYCIKSLMLIQHNSMTRYLLQNSRQHPNHTYTMHTLNVVLWWDTS